MTRMRSPAWRSTRSRTTPDLRGCRRGEAVAILVGGGGVLETVARRQVDAHLVAGGGRDEALGLDLLPRRIEPLGTDEAEDVALAAVLADQGRGEPEPAARLQIGGELEDRRRQQVHLVIDDEAPVQGVEQREMGVLALPLRGEDLVRRDRDGLDLLGLARVLADLLGRERRALEQLVAPLPGAHGVGHEDQRRGLGVGHRSRADERLAGAAGEHDDARAAIGELVDGFALIGPQLPVRFGEIDRMRRPRRVAGEVLGRPADLEELLLDVAARPGVDLEGVGGGAADEEGLDALVLRDLGQHRGIRRSKDQTAVRVALDDQTAVAADGLADVDRHRRRHREARPAIERREHVVGVVAGGAGVPQPEAGDAVRVDVLGRAFELGEDRELVPRAFGVRMGYFQQHRPVALHDERAVSHRDRVYRAGRSGRGHSRPSAPVADGLQAGRTLTMLDTGSVRSMSAARSRPRRRPPPSPVASRVNERSDAVRQPHHHLDDRPGPHRLLELATEPCGIRIRRMRLAEPRDERRERVPRLARLRRIARPGAARREQPRRGRRQRRPGTGHRRATSTRRRAPPARRANPRRG